MKSQPRLLHHSQTTTTASSSSPLTTTTNKKKGAHTQCRTNRQIVGKCQNSLQTVTRICATRKKLELTNDIWKQMMIQLLNNRLQKSSWMSNERWKRPRRGCLAFVPAARPISLLSASRGRSSFQPRPDSLFKLASVLVIFLFKPQRVWMCVCV